MRGPCSCSIRRRIPTKAYEELKRAFKDQKAALKKALEKDPLPKDKEEPVLQIPEASMADFWSNKEIKVDKGMDKEKAKKAREEIYAKYVKEAKNMVRQGRRCRL